MVFSNPKVKSIDDILTLRGEQSRANQAARRRTRRKARLTPVDEQGEPTNRPPRRAASMWPRRYPGESSSEEESADMAAMAVPRHVLLEHDEQGDLHSVGEESDAEEHSDDGAERTTSSRFWGVHQRGDPRSSSPRPTPAPDEPGRRRAAGAPRAQGAGPRVRRVAQAPSRGGFRRAATPVGAPLPAGIEQEDPSPEISSALSSCV